MNFFILILFSANWEKPEQKKSQCGFVFGFCTSLQQCIGRVENLQPLGEQTSERLTPLSTSYEPPLKPIEHHGNMIPRG